MSFLLYYKDKRLSELNKLVRTGFMLCRFLVLFLLAFLLLSPVIKYLKIYFDNPIILFAQDNSSSIGMVPMKDIQSVADYKALINNLQQKLSKNYEIKNYSFGNEVLEDFNVEFKDKKTNFATLFDEIQSKYVNYNVGALIIASDGLYNSGQNPVYASAKLDFPVYTIALGDTTKKKDIILKNVFTNNLAFLGDYFPVEISIHSFGYENEDINLIVTEKGKELYKQNIRVNKNDFSKQLTFNIQANEKGLHSYRIQLESKKGEFNLLNNSGEAVIDIVDDKKKVLILGNAVHPDMGTLKSAISSNNNLLAESFVIDDFKGKISEYQLVIFYQLPTANYNIQKLFDELRQKQLPVLFILGAQTDVSTFNLLKTGLNISGNNRLTEQAIANLNESFLLYDLDEEISDLLPQFPPLTGPFGNFEADNKLDVLLFQQIKGIKTPKPMLGFLAAKPEISGKVSFMAGEGIWKWRMKDFQVNKNHMQFDAFINKIIHFLALDIQKDRFILNYNRIFSESDEISFRAEFYNQSFELNNKSDIAIQISNSENKVFNYQFARFDNSYFLNVGNLPVGDYRFIARLDSEGKEFVKKGEFRVAEINIEQQDLTANHAMLNQLSVQSNAKMFYVNELDKLVNEIINRETIKPISRSIADLVDLIELKWVFFLIIFLLGIEWFLRKFYGSY